MKMHQLSPPLEKVNVKAAWQEQTNSRSRTMDKDAFLFSQMCKSLLTHAFFPGNLSEPGCPKCKTGVHAGTFTSAFAPKASSKVGLQGRV